MQCEHIYGTGMQRKISTILRQHTGVSPETFQFVLNVFAVTASFLLINFFIMRTQKSLSASTVAEIPTQAAIAAKQFEVTYLRNQLMSNLASGQREYFRNLWGKAREELSRMQTLHYFGQKKVCHG